MRERFDAWLETHKAPLRFEEWRPTVLALLASIVAASWHPSGDVLERVVKSVIPVAVTAAALLAGLQTTAQAMMLVVMDKPIAARLAASGHLDVLMRYFRDSVAALVTFGWLGLAAMILEAIEATVPWERRLVPAILAFATVRAGASVTRLNRIMLNLLRH